MRVLKLIIGILSVVRLCDGARILGIVPTPSYSHQVVFQPIFKELSLRGHQVTTVTTDPLNDPTLTNLTEIDLHDSYDIWNKKISMITSENKFNFIFSIVELMEEVGRCQFSHPDVQDLIYNNTKRFDLVMVESNVLPIHVFAKKFNAPLILMSSFDAYSHLREIMGCPTHPIAYSDPLFSIQEKPTFTERLVTVSFQWFIIPLFGLRVIYQQYLMGVQYFGDKYSLLDDVSLVLANSEPIFHGVKPLVPTVVLFGGGSHRTPPKPLPKNLKKILDEAKNGFVYFSLGSNVKTFGDLPYTILWKFEEENLSKKPKNVITSKWLPQQDVLKHPNIKLFITQGGLQSVDEGIFDHVPMIGIPFFADQEFNVNRMVKLGFGLHINYKTMKKEELKAAILEVINNPKYKNRVKEVAELFLDQPMSGLDKAIWWTEYVIRHNGTKHLRSPMLDIPFYQYYLLDVIAVFALVIVVLISVLVLICKLLLKLAKSVMQLCGCARILGIVPTPSYSHQVVFQPIFRELSLRGHQVTTLTTDPLKDPTLTNLTEIDLHDSYDIWNKKISLMTSGSRQTFLFSFLDLMIEVGLYQFSHPDVQDLIHTDTKKFDLVMVEYNFLPIHAFATKFKVPLIVMCSFDANSHVREIIGSPTHPIAYSDPLFTMQENTVFAERLNRAFFTWFFMPFFGLQLFYKQYLFGKQYFGDNYSYQEDVSLVLANSEPIFHGVKPSVPTIVQFGGGFHRTLPKPLPTDLQKILDEAKNGFLYFSLGSNVKSKDLSDSTRDTIIQAFGELPYTILWKFEEDILSNKPKNVIISKWLPQQDILKHPNIKLFITQGGLQSVDEAIFDNVPMIGMPFFADQEFNVNRIVKLGFGLHINYKTMSKEELKTAILEVINNPKYKTKVKEVAKLILDQPMSGLDKAIWWTEYVIRHNGTKHLRSPILDIPFYQYYLLDVIAVFTLAIVVLISVIVLICKVLFKLSKRLIAFKKLKVN
ncbi:hypothetical protein FQR65_LT00894 [Abscondita terminalis]|nr:hypothetical protein FQR65_LT00894 [Abscondita terminalis]